MKDAARSLSDRNRPRGTASWCGREHDFVCPSIGPHPLPWSWDSCFPAAALSHIDPEPSRIEVPSLLANVQPDGFVAHATFWQREKHEDMLGTYAIAHRTSYLSDSTHRPPLAEHERVSVARGAPPRPADLAALTEDRSARLVEDRDLRGYYNPCTGEGASAHDVSGTGVVLDMLARREDE
jgi:hypothetical protein